MQSIYKKTITFTILILALSAGAYLIGVGGNSWPTYESQKLGIKFRYPTKKIDIIESGNSIILRHIISSYPVSNYCGEGPDLDMGTKEPLKDFYLGIKKIEKSLNDTLMEDVHFKDSLFNPDGSFKFVDGYFEKKIFDNFQGYILTTGVEGCGEDNIYIPLDTAHTLRVTKIYDNSNYMLNFLLTDKEKKQIRELLYVDNRERWQVVDEVISSIEIIK